MLNIAMVLGAITSRSTVLAASANYRPDLATAAITLIPLLLIAATIEARLLDYWASQVKTSRTSSARRRAVGFILVVGITMYGGGFTAIFLALWELWRHDSRFDGWVVGLAAYVSLGLLVAFLNQTFRAAGLGFRWFSHDEGTAGGAAAMSHGEVQLGVGGSVTVAHAAVRPDSQIIVTPMGSQQGTVRVTNRQPGQFTVASTDNADAGPVAYQILD